MILTMDEYAPLFDIEGAFEEDITDAKNHGCFVANLAYRLAKVLQYHEDFCIMCAQAGMIHDIGKLMLKDRLGNRKEGILQAEEMRYVRMHPTLGYELLVEKKIGNNELRQSVYHHHENYDGTGYPDNIKGESIPLGARVLRICDVYSALVSDRLYREAYDNDTAVELMIEEVKNFDMRMFLGFMELIHSNEFREIAEFAEQIRNVQGASCSGNEGGVLFNSGLKARFI